MIRCLPIAAVSRAANASSVLFSIRSCGLSAKFPPFVKPRNDDLLVFTALPVNSPKARKLQDGGVEVIHAKTKNGRIDLYSVLAELGRREILSVFARSRPALEWRGTAAGIVHKLFLFYAPTIAGENRVPSRSLRSSVFPRATLHAAVRPRFRCGSLLARPFCVTCSVATDTFCQAYPRSLSRDWHICKERESNAPRCNPIPGLSLFWITGFARFKNTTTSSRQKK